MKYDLIVIGGGPAGYLAAERAGAKGLNVLLFEKRNLGGVCLNEGCVPSKALLYSAKIYDYTKHSEQYGVKVTGSSLDQEVVIKRKNKVVKTLVTGVKGALKKNNVTVVEKTAKIEKKSSEGFVVSADSELYTGDRLLICSGSEPIMPPIPGLLEGYQKGFILTNREILDLTNIPKTLVIVGGGVIGLEMASYFNSAGSKVTVVEMLDRIGGPIDEEIADLLRKEYEKKGITFNLGSKVTSFTEKSVVFEKDGKTLEADAEKVLVSIGRKPSTKNLGLENIGVETDKRGAIVTDSMGRTNVAEVYAAGDVNGVSMLAHTAYREAEVCINNILGKKDVMRYSAIPSVIYTNPEVASVGETVATAKQKNMDFESVTLSMKFSGRYVAENEGGNGICKVLREKNTNRLIGVSLIGNYASEIIYGAAMMIETQMTVDDLKELVFPHPTVCEIIREALFSFNE
ncbi:MAG TPA: dihydrolipoyl dehydrogenase [Clostridia bacterium]|jgi:dihydrolipoamide dehydrogenase|nr:dihydrolipoyl dehydrogenase [Clostridia bacterium]HQM39971.1 dihydrolipoyl dehydrogenase [Clostridia bacterium]